MPTAKRLPSGSWRCQITIGYEDVVQEDGSVKRKVIRKSFTSTDKTRKGKKQCEQEAALYEMQMAEQPEIKVKDKPLIEAMDDYIADKENVLSPTTIRYYRAMQRVCYDEIGQIPVDQLKSEDVQRAINLYAKGRSPKSVRNMYGFITAVVGLYSPDKRFKVSMPQSIRPHTETPSDADVERILQYFRENDREMLKAVYLAAFGTLRRSEVCGAMGEDLKWNRLHVERAMVMNNDRQWVIKTTKTTSSNRYVTLPDFVIHELPTKGRLVDLTPTQISDRFRKCVRDLDLRHFRFHDLRHYAASIYHALGIPDVYIQMQGGWQSNRVLDRVYKDALPEYASTYMDVAMRHFENLSSRCPHEVSPNYVLDIKKARKNVPSS